MTTSAAIMFSSASRTAAAKPTPPPLPSEKRFAVSGLADACDDIQKRFLVGRRCRAYATQGNAGQVLADLVIRRSAASSTLPPAPM
ncbi:MAG: hypothetical protein WDM84_05960 [Bauldia sp.]